MGLHSLLIGNKHTWDNWHIVPESRPVINPPPVKTNYVDIPGMDGSLDYTEVLSGIRYENRTGSWTFYVMNDYGEKNYDYNAWYELYSDILNHIQGAYLPVYSEDDPDYLYRGRLALGEWRSDKDYSKITINYVLDPYKHKVKKKPDGSLDLDDHGNPQEDNIISTSNNDWLWDDLFDITIIYGKFQVDGTKVRNFINDREEGLEVSAKCSSEMIVKYDGKTIKLRSGLNKDSGIILHRGNNYITFEGNGEVVIDYDKDGVII